MGDGGAAFRIAPPCTLQEARLELEMARAIGSGGGRGGGGAYGSGAEREELCQLQVRRVVPAALRQAGSVLYISFAR